MTKLATSLRRAAWVLAGFACLAASSPAWAQETSPSQQTKLDEVVRQAVAEGRSVRAIVRFTDEAARKRGVGMVSHRGGHVRRAFNAVGALSIDVDAATADALAADSGTVSVSIDAQVHSSATGAMWASPSSGADAPRQKLQRGGRSISVAVIDSGVRPHADLPAARIRKFVDFVNGRTAPYDDFGHGTHVAGIVAGSGAASLFLEDPYVGAAPDVDVVALKVLDRTGAGRTSDVLAALEWVAANHTTYNIRVVNLSLGHPVFEPAASDPLVQAAEALARRGIVVVASAGNLGIDWRDGLPGSGGITSPANGPSVIAVGAVDNKGTHARGDDSVPGYSSRGPTRFDLLVKPDLVASAHHVVSLAAPASYLFEKFPGLHVNPQPGAVTQYMTLSGTSMAAPLVAGTAALILDANPRLTAATVRAVLEFTAQQLPDTNLLTQGAGSVNAQGAVRLAGLIKPGTEVGQIWLQSRNGLPQSYDILGGEQTAWAKRVIWGNRVLLGDSAYLHMVAWDDNIVWGQRLDNIVWGQCAGAQCGSGARDQCEGAGCDNIVWGQNQPGHNRPDNIVWGQCGTSTCDNIVWGQRGDNIVWGQRGTLLGYWADNTVWGFWSDVVDWTRVTRDDDNIVWGQDWFDNIVWGQTVLTGGGR